MDCNQLSIHLYFLANGIAALVVLSKELLRQINEGFSKMLEGLLKLFLAYGLKKEGAAIQLMRT